MFPDMIVAEEDHKKMRTKRRITAGTLKMTLHKRLLKKPQQESRLSSTFLVALVFFLDTEIAIVFLRGRGGCVA